MTNTVKSPVIYEPRGKAREYAALAANGCRGCPHACTYCYMPDVLKMPREEFHAAARPRPSFLEALARDAAKLQAKGRTGQVLLSFTCDPYAPGAEAQTGAAISILHAHGFGVATLSKGGARALPYLHLYDRRRDAYAATLTTLDSKTSTQWEPGAALPDDRIEALQNFHRAGIPTWVSLEPTLDADTALNIVRLTHGFVDLFKVGKANYAGQLADPAQKASLEAIDWRQYTRDIVALADGLGVRLYVKRDLQRFLPAGWTNATIA